MTIVLYGKQKKINYYDVRGRANSHNIEGDNNWVNGAWKIMPPGCPGISDLKFLNNGKELKVTFKKPSDDYAIYMQISSSASFNNAYYSPVVVGKGKKSYTYELENKLKNKKLYVRVRYHDEADGKWSDVKIIDPNGQK